MNVMENKMENKAPSKLLCFYSGGIPDCEGRLFDDILSFSDEELEKYHDYIQWIFPTDEPSRFNKNAPLLTEVELEDFQKSKVVQANFFKALSRIMKFYGLNVAFDKNNRLILFEKAYNFEERINKWCKSNNHNLLRITRILKSTVLFGHNNLAAFILGGILGVLPGKNIKNLGEKTILHWVDSIPVGAFIPVEKDKINMKKIFKFKKIHEDAIIPSKAKSGDAGFDLSSIEDVIIPTGSTKIIKTGLIMEMSGYFGEKEYKQQADLAVCFVCSRSGLSAKYSVFCLNAPGIIDDGYRGEICAIMHNAGQNDYSVKKGDRIAQLLFLRVENPEIIEVNSIFIETDRGEGGLGSSGK